MIRIRFHGRGGHGIKTAGRITGTAAYLEGYCVQDSPLYGAERRGAPVAAYTRISPKTVLERGIITEPDVVVIADDSLIDDPLAHPLLDTDPSTILLINTAKPDLKERLNLKGSVHTVDATGISLSIIGKGAAISAAIAGAACRVTGIIQKATMKEAVIKELQSLGLSVGTIEKNVEVALKCFESLPSCKIPSREAAAPLPAKIITIPYHDPVISAPSVYASGNILERETGRWRTFRPVIDYDKCNQCWICFVRCPEGVIALDDEEYPHIDYDHCKGCLVCYEECPTKAIAVEREVKAW